MNHIEYLRSLDWPTLQVLFGIGFTRNDVDDTIEMATRRCEKALDLLHTRCLFSTNLSAYLLNHHDYWPHIDLSELLTGEGLANVKAINIEIDVTARLDHMFVLVNLGESQWYIIQSYVNQYTTMIEPVDIQRLLTTIQRWRVNGVNPSEWRYYFHADMPSTNQALPHVYVARRVFPSNLQSSVSHIYKKVNRLLNDDTSYIHNAEYQCILEPYV